MAHNISRESGRDEVFVAGEAAWHGLGVRVAEAVSASEAIKLAGLEWEVGTDDVRTVVGAPCDGFKATVRRDTGRVLGIVGDDWTPLQNRDGFAFLDSIGKGALKYESAGALGNGERVWIMAQLPGLVEIAKDDTIARYLLFCMGHDGRMGIRAMASPRRVVCENTLQMALGHAERAKFGSAERGIFIRHSSRVEARAKEAARVLGTAVNLYEAVVKGYRAMAAKPISDTQAADYFVAVYPDDPEANDNLRRRAVREHFATLYHGDTPDQRPIRGTVWGAYNAVTRWETHEHTCRGNGLTSQERQFTRDVIDGGGSIGRRAVREALALVG